MKFICTRTCGVYRKGHEYEIERPYPVLVLSAIRAGHLVASGGWCAPSEVVYDMNPVLAMEGMLTIPDEVKITRGGIRHQIAGESGPELIVPAPEPVRKVRKPRKKVAEPTTLESLAAETSKGLDGLRGPAAI